MRQSINRAVIRALQDRLRVQRAELATCTTDAMRACVLRAIDETEWQLEQAKKGHDV